MKEGFFKGTPEECRKDSPYARVNQTVLMLDRLEILANYYFKHPCRVESNYEQLIQVSENLDELFQDCTPTEREMYETLKTEKLNFLFGAARLFKPARTEIMKRRLQ